MTRHQSISFIKSGLRFIGYGLLAVNLAAAALVLMLAETLGILEEVGQNYGN